MVIFLWWRWDQRMWEGLRRETNPFDTIKIRRGFSVYFNSSKQTKHIKNDLIFALFIFSYSKPKYMSIKIYWANKILKSFGNKNLYKFYMYTGIERKKELNVTKILFFFYNKIYWISGLLNFLSRCFSFWSFLACFLILLLKDLL